MIKIVDPASTAGRPRAPGKFLTVADSKFWVRGVTYGTFRPDPDGAFFPARSTVARDLSAIAANGFNAVRTYTAPPTWLLDLAAERGLRVLAGTAWEQHMTVLDDRRRARRIVDMVHATARSYAGHPGLLAVAVGNEIPAPIVRWHGARNVERFLHRLYDAAKDADPTALVTYVNYPTTEYLELPFLDFVSFNVYLEAPDRLSAYLARLQNVAGDRPLLLGEVGLDSRRHGEHGQARSLEWQLRTSFEAGVAGAFVFAWTDEWYRGGLDIDDWDFGLTRRDRSPKPALAAVRDVLADLPFGKDDDWPKISVVVCSYNGARTIRDCLDWLGKLEYPSFEVIVVDDGSTDDTPHIAHEYGVRVISGPNRGLAQARNIGLAAATGEIVAYLDDDAYPDPHWLTYLAAAFKRTEHAAIGGPNIPPPDDGPIADCVAHAPGGPVHVLLADDVAEHIPGCNMAFRKDRLEAIGGFDPRFRRAGDDVDVCWSLEARGHTLGFAGAAMVWHHRRNSIRAYVRQQIGYGEAEALLERKWPEKYNAAGHVSWGGRLYGKGLTRSLAERTRIYHGTWGCAPFQSVYRTPGPEVASLTLMPEWYLLVLALAGLAALGLSFRPLLIAAPLAAAACAASLAQAIASSARLSFGPTRSRREQLGLRALTVLLHLVQPAARLRGRLRSELTPWRTVGPRQFLRPRVHTWSTWTDRWRAPEVRLQGIEDFLRRRMRVVQRGGDWDAWDLEVRAGTLAAVRVVMAVEEHGQGRQLVRVRARPYYGGVLTATACLLVLLTVLAEASGAYDIGALFAAVTALLGFRAFRDGGAAMASVHDALVATGQDGP